MSSIVRTKVIGAYPVALADMKNFLKVTVNTDDNLIQQLIRAATVQAEIITNCALVRSQFVQYMDHFPYYRIRERGYFLGQVGHALEHHHQHHGMIKLKRPPLVSVQSLVYIGQDGLPHTLNPGNDFVVDCADQPGRIRPIPYTVWPLTLRTPNAVAIKFTAGYAPDAEGINAGQTAISEPETSTQALNPTWQPAQVIAQYAFQVDTNGNIWVQQTGPSGTTGAAGNRPAFEAAAIGATVADNTAIWLNVGPLRGFWTPETQYNGQNQWVILDQNSNLQLLVVAALISQTSPASTIVGSVPPAFSTILGALSQDNGINAWRCLGPYQQLGNGGAFQPTAPEQQAAYTIDYTLPDTVPTAIMQLVTHWYYNREPVTPGPAAEVPMHVHDLLGTVTIHDYAPTPG